MYLYSVFIISCVRSRKGKRGKRLQSNHCKKFSLNLLGTKSEVCPLVKFLVPSLTVFLTSESPMEFYETSNVFFFYLFTFEGLKRLELRDYKAKPKLTLTF